MAVESVMRPDFVKLGEQIIEEKRGLLERLAKVDGEVREVLPKPQRRPWWRFWSRLGE